MNYYSCDDFVLGGIIEQLWHQLTGGEACLECHDALHRMDVLECVESIGKYRRDLAGCKLPPNAWPGCIMLHAQELRELLERCGIAPPAHTGGPDGAPEIRELHECVYDHVYTLEEAAYAEFNSVFAKILNVLYDVNQLPHDADSLISIFMASPDIKEARAALIAYRFMKHDGGCPIIRLIADIEADQPKPGTLRWSAYKVCRERIRLLSRGWYPSCRELKDFQNILEPKL